MPKSTIGKSQASRFVSSSLQSLWAIFSVSLHSSCNRQNSMMTPPPQDSHLLVHVGGAWEGNGLSLCWQMTKTKGPSLLQWYCTMISRLKGHSPSGFEKVSCQAVRGLEATWGPHGQITRERGLGPTRAKNSANILDAFRREPQAPARTASPVNTEIFSLMRLWAEGPA